MVDLIFGIPAVGNGPPSTDHHGIEVDTAEPTYGDALRAHGYWFLYLPQYSPDLNPIEMAFSNLKTHLRRIGARTFTEVFAAIREICNMFDPDECQNYFKATGYISR